ncbi:MAG: hypothetical protein JW997_01110 [Actinobacteria bacterium]|nr:hypothetical protein [Actinomycetota bacterium]
MQDEQIKIKPVKDISEFKNCYLFVSKSHLVLNERIDNLKKLLKNQINMEMDFKIFYGGEEINEQEFVNYCNTPSFFSLKKVAVVKNFDKAVASFHDKLLELLNNTEGTISSAIIVLTASKLPRIPIDGNESAKKVKVSSLQGIIKRVSSAGVIENINSPSQDSIKKWLYSKSELDGLTFTAIAVNRFVENVNFDFNLLKKEYDKILLYMASEKEKTVSEVIVNKLVNRVLEMKIFDVVDFIGRRDKSAALAALQSVMEDKKSKAGFNGAQKTDKSVIGILTLIHRMFKSFLYIRSTGSKELLKKYIDRYIGHIPFMAGKVLKNYTLFSKNYSTAEIIYVFDILNSYDISLRTSHDRIIPLLVMKLISDITDVKA